MHELSIAEALRDAVETAARNGGARRVHAIALELGELAAIEVDALRFCLDDVLRGSVAEGARLDVVTVPGRGRCRACGEEGALHEFYDLCGHCGRGTVEPTAGTAMRLASLEVE